MSKKTITWTKGESPSQEFLEALNDYNHSRPYEEKATKITIEIEDNRTPYLIKDKHGHQYVHAPHPEYEGYDYLLVKRGDGLQEKCFTYHESLSYIENWRGPVEVLKWAEEAK